METMTEEKRKQSMTDYLGGYLLIPKSTQMTSSTIMQNVLENFHVEALLYPRFPGGKLEVFSAEELTRLLEDPLRDKGFSFILGQYWGYVSLENVAEYFALAIGFDKDGLEYPDEADILNTSWPPQAPAHIHSFVGSWVAICEKLPVQFGYFSGFTVHSNEQYLHTYVLPPLQNANWAKLMETVQVSWLLYVNQDLAEKGEKLLEEERQKQPHYLAGMFALTMPTGGLFVRIHPDAQGLLSQDERQGNDSLEQDGRPFRLGGAHPDTAANMGNLAGL
jgi:hypothetical protein